MAQRTLRDQARERTVRNFVKRGDALDVPDLTEVQRRAYDRFLQHGKAHDARDVEIGLESLMREVFPIESYDETMKLEYLWY